MSWPQFWQQKTWQTSLLTPLSKLVAAEAKRRLAKFLAQPPQSKSLVLVVGNLAVGGTGKTPFIQWLAGELTARGLKFGVISRGYGGKARNYPLLVTETSEPGLVGDEPAMLAQTLKCPLVVDPKRARALAYITEKFELDLVISDDGLQHFALPRDIELVLMDAARPGYGVGNQQCFPAGPLREPLGRLKLVDAVVFNGGMPANPGFALPKLVGEVQLQPAQFANLLTGEVLDLASFQQKFGGQALNAIAGIGFPQRFFTSLKSLGWQLHTKEFPDHYAYQLQDLSEFAQSGSDQKPLIMTAKDAVKCAVFAEQLAAENWWQLQIKPEVNAEFATELLAKILNHPKMQARQ